MMVKKIDIAGAGDHEDDARDGRGDDEAGNHRGDDGG